MKKLILASEIILICCVVFFVIRQSTSKADVSADVFHKPYSLPFGDWVLIYLSALYSSDNYPDFLVQVNVEITENKFSYKIRARYSNDTVTGNLWYTEVYPAIRESIKEKCEYWSRQGYPITLNDFEFDVKTFGE